MRPNQALGMGLTCFFGNFYPAESQFFSQAADSSVKVATPVNTGIVPGSTLHSDSGRVHLKMVARDSVKISLRSKKALLLQAQKDSVQRQALIQDLPVYAAPNDFSGISMLPAPLQVNQQHWMAGKPVNEPTKGLESKPFDQGIPDWTILFWLGSLAILLWARKSFARYFSHVINSVYDYTLSLNLFKDRNILLQRVSNLLQLNFMLVGALFIYLLWPHIPGITGWSSPTPVLLIACCIPPALVLFRWLINNGLGFLFSREKVFSEYNFQVQLNYKLLGIILLPIIILSLYFNIASGKTLLIVGIILIISMYLHRLYRGYKIIVQHHVSIFYTILYLCTFEILPLILLFKLYGKNAG
ncbi:MAG: DUF4271 domain-containing protein [Bacteroidales bacterium]